MVTIQYQCMLAMPHVRDILTSKLEMTVCIEQTKKTTTQDSRMKDLDFTAHIWVFSSQSASWKVAVHSCPQLSTQQHLEEEVRPQWLSPCSSSLLLGWRLPITVWCDYQGLTGHCFQSKMYLI